MKNQYYIILNKSTNAYVKNSTDDTEVFNDARQFDSASAAIHYMSNNGISAVLCTIYQVRVSFHNSRKIPTYDLTPVQPATKPSKHMRHI